MAKKYCYDKESDIEYNVLRVFIRLLKENGQYIYYLGSLQHDFVTWALLNKLSHFKAKVLYNSPFIGMRSIDEIVYTLKMMTQQMAVTTKDGDINYMDTHQRIGLAVNHLVHFFLEANGFPLPVLCSFGEEVYCMVCKQLYGYTDEELGDGITRDMTDITSPEQMRMVLLQDYVTNKKRGNINKDTNFRSFILDHQDEFKRFNGYKMEELSNMQNMVDSFDFDECNPFMRRYDSGWLPF